ncbi:MAG TPA: hypothetical protein VND64_11830 [Pirellulales bacterium]|nr:hypothetical protein [Pirellulales bacterium]
MAVECVQPQGNDTIAGPIRRGASRARANNSTTRVSGLHRWRVNGRRFDDRNGWLYNPDHESIIFDFLNGPLDGATWIGESRSAEEELSLDTEDFERLMVSEIYRATNGGAVGERFRCCVPNFRRDDFHFPHVIRQEHSGRHYLIELVADQLPEYDYEITDRLEVGNEVLIQATCRRRLGESSLVCAAAPKLLL